MATDTLLQFVQFANVLSNPVFLVRGDGTVVAGNHSAARRVGVPLSGFADQPLASFLTDTIDTLDLYLKACSRTSSPVPGSLSLQTSDGTGIPCHADGALLFPRTEYRPALIVISLVPKEEAPSQFAVLNLKLGDLTREVVSRREAEMAARESEERFHQLADAMPQIVWTARPDGYLDYYNERWYAYTGLPPGGGGDKSWEPVLHPDDVEKCHCVWYSAVQSGEPYEIEYRFRDLATGGYRWFLGRAEPVRNADGEIVKWFGTCTDIDEQKRTAEELERRQRDVEDLNERLRRAMQETHHRVKNNLQVISALIDLGVMNDQETVSVTELVRLNHHVRALAAVHDVLTLEARDDPAADYLDMRQMFDRLIPMIRATCVVTSVQSTLGMLRLPIRHGTALSVILNELVLNAAKHAGGKIEVTLLQEGEQAVLTVCDSGPGFPSDFSTTASTGTGLDLVERLARWDLQGEIRYENRTEGGACVEVRFGVR